MKLDLLINFLKDPKIAAVMPSSRYVVENVLGKIDFGKASMILEYGAGDGVVTRKVLKKARDDAKMLAFEPNDKLHSKLQKMKDRRLSVVKDYAHNSGKYFDGKADLILASIPFSQIDGRQKLLRSMSQDLKDDGKLIIYSQYYPVKLRKELPKHFSKVKMELEPRNLPPAFIFTCQK